MRNEKTLFIGILLLLCTQISVNGTSAKRPSPGPAAQLTIAKDSLLRRLHSHISPKEKLLVLTNLGDVCLNLNNDYGYVEKLWNEALRQHNNDAIITAGRSLTLRGLNLGETKSVDQWIKLCEKEFKGPMRHSALSYLYLMRDIRLFENQSKMAAEMIYKQLRIKQTKDPYEKMSMLYKLGTLALTAWNGNVTLKMKPWDEYMVEGYQIAKTLPFEESYSFRHQFLMALCYQSLDYNKEFVALLKQHRREAEHAGRPFTSHRGDIIACSHLFEWSDKLPRKEVDRWFGEFCKLTSDYPYDCPTPYDFYFYSKAINYYIYTKDNTKIVQCCDSAIVNAPKYKMDNLWFYEVRGETLAAMGRWKEAYENSKALIAGKDSIAKSTAAAQLMELQTQYKVDRLTFAKKNSELRFIFAALLCVLLAAGLWLLYRHYHTLRRKNAALFDAIRQLEDNRETTDTAQNNIPDEKLSREELLYRNLCKLMRDEKPFVEQIGRKELADRLGTNVTYIAEAVKQGSDGMKVSEFINLYRLRFAGNLLSERLDLSINAVGEEAGFTSRTTYYRSFSAYFGMSPNEYRNIARSKKVEKEK